MADIRPGSSGGGAPPITLTGATLLVATNTQVLVRRLVVGATSQVTIPADGELVFV